MTKYIALIAFLIPYTAFTLALEAERLYSMALLGEYGGFTPIPYLLGGAVGLVGGAIVWDIVTLYKQNKK